ncbi:MAG: hypothetical protein HYY17_09090 [Planctomycetes bacterium]|nr:hypothetical protein [Planctomycetota bacterium]
MDPALFRSTLRGNLIELGSNKPANLDDLVMAWDTPTRDHAIVLTTDRKRPGDPRELLFPNGSTLRLRAAFSKEKKEWKLREYSFHFVPSDGKPWFRYDLDPDRAQRMCHPLAHLHVGEDDPRFPTGERDLLELLRFLDEQGLLGGKE